MIAAQDPHALQQRVSALLAQKITSDKRISDLMTEKRKLIKLLSETNEKATHAAFDLVDLQNDCALLRRDLSTVGDIIWQNDPCQLTAMKAEPQTDYERAIMQIFEIVLGYWVEPTSDEIPA